MDITGITTVFTMPSREKYWCYYIPILYIFASHDQIKPHIENVIMRQRLLKEKINLQHVNIIFDSTFYNFSDIPQIPVNLGINIINCKNVNKIDLPLKYIEYAKLHTHEK